jgi:3,4-dihydroxy 2-butanone 4-phosphate synthase/GTP cyclohydrolase II
MEKIAERGEGMVIHIPRQDGRGMGLPFKLATLRLQAELKVDTVAASYLLDPDGSRDVRTYAGVIAIFKYLEIPTTTNINLETNNPKKLEVFAENNYIVKADPLVIPATEDTLIHLRAKQEELGHMNLIEDSKGEKE